MLMSEGFFISGETQMNKLLAASVLTIALMGSTASFAQLNVGGAVTGSGGVSVDGTSGAAGATIGGAGGGQAGDANAAAAGSTNVETNVDSSTDASTTASVGASVNSAFEAMGPDADAFFTSSDRTTLRSSAEIRAAFDQMSTERQEGLRRACEGDVAKEGFCPAIR